MCQAYNRQEVNSVSFLLTPLIVVHLEPVEEISYTYETFKSLLPQSEGCLFTLCIVVIFTVKAAVKILEQKFAYRMHF